MCRRLLEGLAAIPGLRIVGITDTARLRERCPTVSFVPTGVSPQELHERLGARGVFTWAGNNYALALTTALGLEPEGVWRVGILHYATAAEVDPIMPGLRDQHDHVVRLALTAAGLNCPEAAVPRLVTRAISGSNTDQRVAAIRVLGETRHPSALSTLLRVAAPRRGLLGAKPPAKTPEYLAALTGLQRYLQDPRAREALAVAAQSRDRDVVRAAQQPHPEGR